MPFYLEYTVNQNADIRSALDGNSREEALPRAADAVRRLDCGGALLRFSDVASVSFGNGQLVATYTRTEGWETPRQKA